jgi:hypothetical protein
MVHASGHPSVLRASVLALLITLFSFVSFGQEAKVLAPHKHALPLLPYTGKWHKAATLRSMVGGPWIVDANFKSSIYIKNSIKMAPLTVTPILYLSNGRRYQLLDVKLEPAGVAVVNVNQALADQGLAPWATLRGYVEVEYKWPWDALCVTVRNVDAVHSLVIAHNLRQATLYSAESGTDSADHGRAYEGVWWKQEPNVSGFISLSNSSTTPISARVQVIDNHADVLGTHTVTVSPHGTKTVNLTELQSTPAKEGGVHITYVGPEDALLLTGELEDALVGFSAKLPLYRAPKHSNKQESLTYAALGLMTGEVDPMMRFPVGTKFTPYFVVRNLSDHPTSFQPKVYWAENSASHSLSLPQFSIASGAAMNLDLSALISSSSIRNFNGNINVELDIKGPYGDLLMASGSVDQKNTYVFEAAPQAVAVSVAKSLSYWSTANGDDTMFTLWNPADEAQDFLFTVFFSRGHYEYPIHLGPKATRSFNMSEIVEAQTPDTEGNVIPAGVHEGSAEIAGPEGATQPILAAIDLGIYNVQKATCYPTCIDCNGVADDWIDANPFGVAVGGKIQQTATAQFHDGTKADLTNSATWKSSNTGVATVSAGLVTGVGAGPLELSAEEELVTQIGEVCQNEPPPRCQEGPVQPSSPGTVPPKISQSTELWYFGNGISAPSGFTLGSTTATLTANGGSGTYTWTVTNGTSIAALQGTTSGQNVTSVTIGSIGYSTSANDVTVQLQYTPTGGKAATSSISFSVDSPYKLASNGATTNKGVTGNTCNNPPPGNNGFQSVVPYKILSFFGVQISHIGVNETFATWTDDYIGNNWPVVVAGGYTTTDGTFADYICAINTTTPPSLPPQVPLSATKIDHASQFWFVGSVTPSDGVEVQSDTFQRYQDHGLHTGIVSPVR